MIANDKLPLVLSSTSNGNDIRIPKSEEFSLRHPGKITWGESLSWRPSTGTTRAAAPSDIQE